MCGDLIGGKANKSDRIEGLDMGSFREKLDFTYNSHGDSFIEFMKNAV